MSYYHLKVDSDKLKIYVVNPKKQNPNYNKMKI